MKINEVFDSNIELHWQQNGRFELAGFMYNNHKYVIQIEQMGLPFSELRGAKTAEVSFFREMDNDEESFSTTKDVNYPFAVYGIVANNIMRKFAYYDAFLFAALRRHSSSTEEFEAKKRIYVFLADKLAKRSGAKLYEYDRPTGFEGVVSKIEVVSESFINARSVALSSVMLEYVKIK